MKEAKLLNRVQAEANPYSILLLATVQEYGLKTEFACNNYFHISLQLDITVFLKSLIVKLFWCKTYNLLRVFSQCLEMSKGESYED